jgi:hypothetical protein
MVHEVGVVGRRGEVRVGRGGEACDEQQTRH